MNGVQVKTEEDSTPTNIRRVCENSLRNLGVETLGIFYQHRVDPATPIEVVAETCGELIREGKILHWGMCEVNAETIRRAHKVCPVTAIQSEYHSCTARWKKTACWRFARNWVSVSCRTAR